MGIFSNVSNIIRRVFGPDGSSENPNSLDELPSELANSSKNIKAIESADEKRRAEAVNYSETSKKDKKEFAEKVRAGRKTTPTQNKDEKATPTKTLNKEDEGLDL